MANFEFDWISWVVIPVLIFCARLLDVSMATVRNILSNRGFKKAAPIIGFFEVLIWLIAITQVMRNLNNVASYLSWAFGFSAGNYLGIVLEEKIALGFQIVRVFVFEKSSEIASILREKNFGVTSVQASGSRGPVTLLFVVTKRKRLKPLLSLLKENVPTAFYTIEDVRKVNSGIFGQQLTEPFLNGGRSNEENNPRPLVEGN